MTTIFSKNGITVTRQNWGWPIGTMYRVSDNFVSFSMGECPPLDEANLLELIKSYKLERWEEMTAEAQCETHHMID